MSQQLLSSGFVRPAVFDHWARFVEFCRYEQMTGGPDPHMRAVVELCRGLPAEEKLWRSHLYVGVYNVPSAEAIWRQWDLGRFCTDGSFEHWLDKHWPGLYLRRERRTVKSPRKLAAYCEGVLLLGDAMDRLRGADFEEVWRVAMALPHVGRYAATKLTEIWHRLGLVGAECPDIRAEGGWSPRAGLQLLFGGEGDDPRDDRAEAVSRAEAAAAEVRLRLEQESVKVTPFEVEVMLCEYKESYSTRRQYPGRSLDSELAHERKVAGWWAEEFGPDTAHIRVRPVLSPAWALGELQGWEGVRPELGQVLSRWGYTWSDALYDWSASRNNLAEPVPARGVHRHG